MRLNGGLINRDCRLRFRFDGRPMEGYGGDTLASALLANGQRVVGRSFKYHRPRGILSAGSEEPNALVHVHDGAAGRANTKATMVELTEGLQACSQHRRGSLSWDWMGWTDRLWPFLGAGFYYKTFMWPPRFWEKVYEPLIRRSAGLGALPGSGDPMVYHKGFLHCDVLVVGAGAAGLMAALGCARAGLRVIVADEDFRMGGRLLAEGLEIDGGSGVAWAERVLAELASFPDVRLMRRTVVYGRYDHGVHGAWERKEQSQVLWRVYSRHTIVCAGSTERVMAFGHNDRPGVMLAGAVRAYVNRWAVSPGHEVVVFTNNDSGWRTGQELARAGVAVAAVVDSRPEAPGCVSGCEVPGAEKIWGAQVVDCHGRMGLSAVRLSNGRTLHTDCLAVSGGWSPNLQLGCHTGNKPVWDEGIHSFVPGPELPAGMTMAGAAAGALTLGDALQSGAAAGLEVAQAYGRTPKLAVPGSEEDRAEGGALWFVAGGGKRAWVDMQHDVTVKDIEAAYHEGFRVPEHVKRYTTLGMATDQGRTGHPVGLGVLAGLSGQPMAEMAPTTWRPPYTPVPIGAFAGQERGRHFRPTRHTPSHGYASEQGAVFVEAGLWLRAQWIPRSGEQNWLESVNREVRMTRNGVGICDVSTLGKIDIRGQDGAVFLDRVYANAFARLAVGRVRYGVMLREDGLVMDDGTTARLGEDHYVMTTTTANAGLVMRHLEFCRQCLWPELDVHLQSITDGWAQYAVAGPYARALLERVVEADISNNALPFMGCMAVPVCGGVEGRLFRISFSGELAYELAVPAGYGDALVRALVAAGADWDAGLYGTEALGVMRIEKGHPAGPELDGRTTALALGLQGLLEKKQAAGRDFIGSVLLRRPALVREDGHRMVGLRPVDTKSTFAAGAHVLAQGVPPTLETSEGWVSSVAYSPTLGHTIGLGFLRRGHQRLGERVRALDPVRGRVTDVVVSSPHFVDPEGSRLRG